jgi:hypothetical protein
VSTTEERKAELGQQMTEAAQKIIFTADAPSPIGKGDPNRHNNQAAAIVDMIEKIVAEEKGS